MRRARRLTTGLVTLGVLAGALLFSSAPALAAEAHDLLSTFNGSDAPGGPFSFSLRNVAVDQSSNDVYVDDRGRNVVDKFTSAGAYIPGSELTGTPAGCSTTCPVTGPGVLFGATAVAVDPTTGDVYVIDLEHKVIDRYSSSAAFIVQFNGSTIPAGLPGSEGTFSPRTGIAVDPATHDVYVADESGVILKFTPAGVYVSQFPVPSATGIAVNPTGSDMYVATAGNVQQFSSAGVPGAVIDSSGAAGPVAVDPSTGDVYVADGSYIAQYDSAGAPITRVFGSNALSTAGIAVDGSSGRVYESDNASVVNIFGPPVTVADVTTEAPTPVTRTTALLHGAVNPVGIEVTSCELEWGTEAGVYPQTAACSPAPGKVNALVPVSAELTGLTPATTYHYRLAATDANGTNYGQEESFTTPVAVEGVLSGPASAVLITSATLNGSLEPNGFDTHYWFEYGLSESYGSTTPHEDAGSAIEVKHVSAQVTSLTPNSTYYFRLVAENSTGVTYGPGATLKTEPNLAVFGQQLPVTSITRTTATVSSKLNPEGNATTYRVLYGRTSSYGGSTSDVQAGSGSTEGTVSAGLTGLTPNTTYHYAFVASNVEGSVTGPEGTFTTALATPPTATTGGASNVTLTGATVAGTIETQGLETSYELDLGTDTTYGTSIYGEAGSGPGSIEVTIGLQNLAPGATYHYRLVAINSDGRSYGADRTFTTPAYSNPIVLPNALPLLQTPPIAFPTGSQANTGKIETKKLTNAQKLSAALKACAKKPKSKRAACRKQAHKKYPPAKKKKK
jgi:phosphodiesterase/alkaline phosphatase D-like protein